MGVDRRSLARRERVALVETMRDTGPDAPTLCEGWTARDLAAHLVVREARPDAAAGVVLPALSARLETLRLRESERPWEELLDSIASGPPWYSPLRLADSLANTAEYLVHHEDVRRAGEGWSKREFDSRDLARVWTLATIVTRSRLRKVPARIDLSVPRGPSSPHPGVDAEAASAAAPVSTGAALAPLVTVVAEPVELLLWTFGRERVDVEISGAQRGIDALEAVGRSV